MASSSSVGDSRGMVLKERLRTCKCGRQIEIKVSGTPMNPNHLFYLCKACGFKGWCFGSDSVESGPGYVGGRDMDDSRVRMLLELVNDMRNEVGKCKEKVIVLEEKCRMHSLYAMIVAGVCIVNFLVGLCAMMVRK